ncbi:mycofactocin-coupled SDR family oxidoreductase [Saccharomonospora iraqiensis]|uniref:mycofactocin-coupled SDR family oxidoreductase n=1 Tax=Saccharomonospora iraqiensis TaxID=52698 RepID=UPI00040C8B7F|nr:mycofactocin-coupled SDR family oxidoreductase [Saccharomonospora iraqiensis]
MGSLDGKVAFITGAARAQGRNHAVRMAEEGADIIAVDLCDQIDTVPYQMSTPDDLDETVGMVEARGRRIVAREADVRDPLALQAAFDAGLTELGRVDIVVANAGIAALAPEETDPVQAFNDTIATNLAGVRHTVHAAAPTMIEQNRGGAMVLTSSTQGLSGRGGNGTGGLDGYTAAKHGVVGLMRSYANWLAPHGIRVNTLHPTAVRTPMVENETVPAFMKDYPDMANAMANLLPVEMMDHDDTTNAVLWLVSDRARYVTGVTLPVDAGFCVR